MAKTAKSSPVSPKASTGPKDVFLHLLIIILLYFSAINFGILLYQFINIYFPDPLTDLRYFSPEIYYGPLRWSVAALIIVFPAYVWLSWYLHRDYQNHPEKLELKTRKWLLNLTLFIAALVIIGDLVALVYRYLNGDLTTRFGLKVLTILSIAIVVFFHYLNQLRRPQQTSPANKALIFIVIIAIITSVIAGFWIAGSPQTQRLRRFDQRRIADLQDIQWRLVDYWQKKQQLPENLSALNDQIAGYRIPTDPQTGFDYEYNRVKNLKFEICATFNLEATDNQNTYPERMPIKPATETETWTHPAGRYCFQRTIDPELYKQIPAPIEKPPLSPITR